MKKPANAGFGAVAMILGFIALLAFATSMASYYAKQDQATAQETTQVTSIAQQAEIIRNVIRRCAARMNSKDVRAAQPSPGQPYDKYPGCKTIANDETSGNCSLASGANEGAILTADLMNVWCDGVDKYAFDTDESVFNLKPITGFSPWTYRKTESDGVYVLLTANSNNNHFTQVLSQLRTSFNDNELTEATIAPDNANTIGIYIFREVFPGGGGNNNGDEIPDGMESP